MYHQKQIFNKIKFCSSDIFATIFVYAKLYSQNCMNKYLGINYPSAEK